MSESGAGAAQPAPAYLVFSDVDDTLLAGTSLWSFLRFFWAERHGAEQARQRVERTRQSVLEVAARAGRPGGNRAFFRAFAGEDVAEVTAAGARWFAELERGGGLWVHETLAALREHQAAGAMVVLVSGSFWPCLAPVAPRVGAGLVVCTEPEIVAGRFTGAVAEPMIGEAKAAAVRRVLARYPAVDAAACVAFGDHPSDLPMMRAVGHAVAVGDDPEVVAFARGRTAAAVRLPGAGTAADRG